MKRVLFLMIMFFVIVSGREVFSASLTILSPSDDSSILKAKSTSITWNAVGTTNGFEISLWKNGILVSVIKPNLSAGNGIRTLSWIAPFICGTGYQIKIREKNTSISDFSETFNIIGCGELSFITIRHDLQIKDIRYEFSRGGWIVARIKSNENNFNGDVKFSIQGRLIGNSSSILSKRLNIPKRVTRDVYLVPLNASSIPPSGSRIIIQMDIDNKINETNERNNRMEKKISNYDIFFNVRPRNSVILRKLYFKGGKDYRLEFDLKIKHNYHRALERVSVNWNIMEVGGAYFSQNSFDERIPYIIERIEPGVEYKKHFNLTFGRHGRRNAKSPKLKKGKSYRVSLKFDDTERFHETNERNNFSSFTFRVPK